MIRWQGLILSPTVFLHSFGNDDRTWPPQELSEFFEELYGDESDYDSEDESEEEVEESKAEAFF